MFIKKGLKKKVLQRTEKRDHTKLNDKGTVSEHFLGACYVLGTMGHTEFKSRACLLFNFEYEASSMVQACGRWLTNVCRGNEWSTVSLFSP